MYRMRQREFIAGADRRRRSSCAARCSIWRDRHRETLFAAHTHTQPAQPTTIAHYLLAVIEQLERDARRLQRGLRATNRNPLGACAITGTGFPIDRAADERSAGLRRPDRQHLRQHRHRGLPARERRRRPRCCSTGLGRFVQDLLLWCTAEFGYLRLGDGFVQCEQHHAAEAQSRSRSSTRARSAARRSARRSAIIAGRPQHAVRRHRRHRGRSAAARVRDVPRRDAAP